MRFKVALIVLAAVLVVVVALYAPAQQYYTAWRTNGVLEAQKAQEDAENQELQADNDSLMSLDGIEERAREKGYVNEGETALKVEGLPAEEDSSDQEEAPQEALPWYLSVGDFIFRYQEPEAS